MYERIQETASWLKSRMKTNPKTAIVLGTGLGQLASEITDSYEFPYQEIPNFPVSTVEGHSGKLLFGKLGGVDLMAMKLTTTQISATYDMHCFNIAFSWVPMGQWKSYSFRIAANASALADLLRFKKSESYMDNMLK